MAEAWGAVFQTELDDGGDAEVDGAGELLALLAERTSFAAAAAAPGVNPLLAGLEAGNVDAAAEIPERGLGMKLPKLPKIPPPLVPTALFLRKAFSLGGGTCEADFHAAKKAKFFPKLTSFDCTKRPGPGKPSLAEIADLKVRAPPPPRRGRPDVDGRPLAGAPDRPRLTRRRRRRCRATTCACG